jgi:hypothetical protein
LLHSGFMEKTERGLRHAQALGAWEPWSDADVVWSLSEPAPFPHARRVIYGPHFSVFPDSKYMSLPPAKDDRLVYVQPSKWAANIWGATSRRALRSKRLWPWTFPCLCGR